MYRHCIGVVCDYSQFAKKLLSRLYYMIVKWMLFYNSHKITKLFNRILFKSNNSTLESELRHKHKSKPMIVKVLGIILEPWHVIYNNVVF